MIPTFACRGEWAPNGCFGVVPPKLKIVENFPYKILQLHISMCHSLNGLSDGRIYFNLGFFP